MNVNIVHRRSPQRSLKKKRKKKRVSRKTILSYHTKISGAPSSLNRKLSQSCFWAKWSSSITVVSEHKKGLHRKLWSFSSDFLDAIYLPFWAFSENFWDIDSSHNYNSINYTISFRKKFNDVNSATVQMECLTRFIKNIFFNTISHVSLTHLPIRLWLEVFFTLSVFSLI